ncbi:cytochrome c oxidase assembly protein subunit 15 [Bogoriella caseilytica]|uniref:Cytochrome c oxidase assembly protein subunit 15 n=1 Tax=Bogoriella caseilytica TaxID=56055 RepID=A0A3N2BG84_9MICO|nr:cytochrome c oxidase assembly protein subunit 15 [Bogoriella caseilytica]
MGVQKTDRLTWRLALANLVAQIAIIVTGGAVRLTGSGLGCPEWPLCEPGSLIPREMSSIHPYVEFGNRLMSPVLLVITVALIWAFYRRPPMRSRPLRLKRLPWLVLAGIAVQAVIGGISVWTDLHSTIVGVHMLISLVLVAFSMYLMYRLASPDTRPQALLSSARRFLPWALAALITAVVVLGTVVTGAGPHSGDAEAGHIYDIDPVLAARLHAVSVWVFLAVVVLVAAVLFGRQRPDPRLSGARRAWWWVLAATVFNGAVGYVQHATGLPELLVGLHMLGSGLIVAATTWLCAALYYRPEHVGTTGETTVRERRDAHDVAIQHRH